MAMDTEHCALCYERFPKEKYRYYLCPTCSKALKQAKKDNLGIQSAIDRRLALFDHSCAYCKGRYEVWDHVIPKKFLSSYFANIGERDVFALGLGYNFVPACELCNSIKSGRDLTWMYVYLRCLRKNSFDLSTLEQIAFRHQFAPDHWLDFIIRARAGVIVYDAAKVDAWDWSLLGACIERGRKRHWQGYPGNIFKIGDRVDVPGDFRSDFGEGIVVKVESVAGQEIVTIYMHGGRLIKTTVEHLVFEREEEQ